MIKKAWIQSNTTNMINCCPNRWVIGKRVVPTAPANGKPSMTFFSSLGSFFFSMRPQPNSYFNRCEYRASSW